MTNKFLQFLKFILLTVICIVASIVLVWPLWKFSTGTPLAYTITVLVILAALLLFVIIRKIISSGWKSSLKVFINLGLIFGGLFFSVKSVLREQKIIGLIIFIAAILIITGFNLIYNRICHE